MGIRGERWIVWAALSLGPARAGHAETLESGDSVEDATDDTGAGERDHGADFAGSSRRLHAKGSGEHPVLLVEPAIEAVFPHYGGFALHSNLLVGRVNLNASGGLGVGLFAVQGVNYLVEAYLGYAVAAWRGRTTAKRVLDTQRSFGGVTVLYDTIDVPKQQLVVVEAGFDNVKYTFQQPCAQPGCPSSSDRVHFDARITTFAAGIRYLYAYDGEIERENVRRTWSAYAHVLALPVGFPSGDVTLWHMKEVVKPGPVGFRAGVEFAPFWPFWTMRLAAGYEAAAPVPYFEFGAGVNLWPLF